MTQTNALEIPANWDDLPEETQNEWVQAALIALFQEEE